ncbi:MAG: hypothetical protein ACKVQS_14610 [Fimbriimonadaceae bacterium]
MGNALAGFKRTVYFYEIVIAVFFIAIVGPLATYGAAKLIYDTDFSHELGVRFALFTGVIQAILYSLSKFVTGPILLDIKIDLSETTTRFLLAIHETLFTSRFFDFLLAIIFQKWLIQSSEFPAFTISAYIVFDLVRNYIKMPKLPNPTKIMRLSPRRQTAINHYLEFPELSEKVRSLIRDGYPFTAQRIVFRLPNFAAEDRKLLLALIANDAQPNE